MTERPNLLLIDDDPSFSQVMSRALSRLGYHTHIANTLDSALTRLNEQIFQRAIVDLKLADASGLTLIPLIKQQQPAIEIVMLTGYSSIATAVEAVKLGACNYLCKPASAQDILNAFEQQAMNTEVPEHPPSVDRLEWEHIQKVLQENNNNISATARALAMHRRTLQRKLQKRPVKR